MAHPHEPLQGSCAANEVWSYGSATQVHLEKYVRVRKQLKPYIAELAGNVSKATLISIAGTTSSVGTVTIDPVENPAAFANDACFGLADPQVANLPLCSVLIELI